MRTAEHAYTTPTEHAAERRRLRVLRTQMESTLEEMIELLDVLDGDPDLEDGADDELTGDEEPTLGWSAGP